MTLGILVRLGVVLSVSLFPALASAQAENAIEFTSGVASTVNARRPRPSPVVVR